jgi:phosphoserine aminotransferase
VEDYLDALKWAGAQGGLDALIARSLANLAVVTEWVRKTDWVEFLAASPDIRSNTSVCLMVTSAEVAALPEGERAKFLKEIAGELARQEIAFDINSYKDAPPGFRFWCGPTVEADDLRAALAALERTYLQKVAARQERKET